MGDNLRDLKPFSVAFFSDIQNQFGFMSTWQNAIVISDDDSDSDSLQVSPPLEQITVISDSDSEAPVKKSLFINTLGVTNVEKITPKVSLMKFFVFIWRGQSRYDRIPSSNECD